MVLASTRSAAQGRTASQQGGQDEDGNDEKDDGSDDEEEGDDEDATGAKRAQAKAAQDTELAAHDAAERAAAAQDPGRLHQGGRARAAARHGLPMTGTVRRAPRDRRHDHFAVHSHGGALRVRFRGQGCALAASYGGDRRRSRTARPLQADKDGGARDAVDKGKKKQDELPKTYTVERLVIVSASAGALADLPPRSLFLFSLQQACVYADQTIREWQLFNLWPVWTARSSREFVQLVYPLVRAARALAARRHPRCSLPRRTNDSTSTTTTLALSSVRCPAPRAHSTRLMRCAVRFDQHARRQVDGVLRRRCVRTGHGRRTWLPHELGRQRARSRSGGGCNVVTSTRATIEWCAQQRGSRVACCCYCVLTGWAAQLEYPLTGEFPLCVSFFRVSAVHGRATSACPAD